jgi:hypothetical protein
MKSVIWILVGLGLGWPACVVYDETHRDAAASRLEQLLVAERQERQRYERLSHALAADLTAARLELDRLRRLWMRSREFWWLDTSDLPAEDRIPPQNVPVLPNATPNPRKESPDDCRFDD